MAQPIRRLRKLLCSLAVLAAGCGSLEPPEQAGELVVGILADPVFYQPSTTETDEGGFEHDLVRAFAGELKLKVRFVPVPNLEQLQAKLAKGEVHFAAAMPALPQAEFRYTSSLRQAKQLVIQHADTIPLEDPEDLAGHAIETLPGSPESQTLRSLDLPAPPTVLEVRVANGIDLLERVAENQSELAAIDSAHFDLAVNYYPDLVVAQELPATVAYAWAFRPEDEALRLKAEDFLAQARKDGMLARLNDRYFGHIKRINPIGTAQFIEHMQTLLPHYRQQFQDAQTITGIDWRLLAALAYQESQWNPLATSFTGVRGMMMLTEDTADRLRVNNRLDPKQCIPAGARYLADLRDQLPERIANPDRLWLALAAYNLGMGHLNGARQFAPGLKRDPDSWYDMKKVLPLLSRPEYYERLKSGRARGGEAVIMVENVRTYYDILTRFEQPFGLTRLTQR